MSALGQKQTLTRCFLMSALPPKADIVTAVISTPGSSCKPRIAVDLSFLMAAVAEPPARKQLGLARGRSLTLPVSPNAERRRPTTSMPIRTTRTL